jgi:capsular polysaccharide export protein
VVVWGLRDKPDVRALAARHDVPIWRMEDGFLRSVGLGSDFNIPASLVLDRTGIYFDPTRPSDLETLLQTARFEPAELTRAAALRGTIVASALTKYNFAGRKATLARPDHKRVILVPGQVEDDASIRLGCRDIRENLSLLREVRANNPDAFVMFKPHPDLLAGNREQGRVNLDSLRASCDRLILDEPLPACLAIADEVHTMTSLVGFEALLRGLSVHTYGCPFYSGWGLTHDRHRVERRTRRLTHEELVAGVLIRYPLYMSRKSWQLTTPEGVIAELLEELERRPAQSRVSPFERKARKLLHAVRGILRGA